MEVTPSMREASKTLNAPPSGGEPNKSAGRINVSSLLKALDALSQYPNLTSKLEKENSELYLAHWESNIKPKEKLAFIAPNLGPLPVCLLFIRTSVKSTAAALNTVISILKTQHQSYAS